MPALGFQDFDYTQTHFDLTGISGAGVKINISGARWLTNPPANFSTPRAPSSELRLGALRPYVRAAVAPACSPCSRSSRPPPMPSGKSGCLGPATPTRQFGLFGEAIAVASSGAIPACPGCAVRGLERAQPTSLTSARPRRAQRVARAYRECPPPGCTGSTRTTSVAGATFPSRSTARAASRSGLTASCARSSVCPRSSRCWRACRAARRSATTLTPRAAHPQGRAPGHPLVISASSAS
jgi:hypothetical protein